MPRFLQKLVYKTADILYYLEGCPKKIGPDGELHMSGRVGAFLAGRDTVRLQRMEKRLSRTDMGRALFDFLREQKIDICFDHAMGSPKFGAGGGYYDDGVITLNTRYTDDMLIGILAHEIRHAWQKRQPGRPSHAEQMRLPPDAAIIINRIVEADAFTFEQLFLEDYAAKTGNGRPLRLLYKEQGLNPVPENQSRREKFLMWYDRFVTGGVYDRNRLSLLLQAAERRNKGEGGSSLFSPGSASGIVSATLKAFGIEIDGAEFAVKPVVTLHPFLTDTFNAAVAAYDRDLTAQKKTAPKRGPFPKK